MKAVIIHSARDLRIGEAETPGPGPNDVEVRIRAGGICGSDLHYYQHGGFGTVRIREPLIPGHEIAGEVTSIGSAVRRVRPGDRVAVAPSRPCGHCEYWAWFRTGQFGVTWTSESRRLFKAGFRLRGWPVREPVSLPRSSALRLNGSQAQQCQPVRMALAGH